jgi:hypothetical protein
MSDQEQIAHLRQTIAALEAQREAGKGRRGG